MLNEFKQFVSRGNALDLAVGIIMGAAFTAIVNSLVKDVIMPPIGLATGGVDFSSLFVALNGHDYPSLKAAQDAGAPTINYGIFINAIINFLIVAVVVFFLIRSFNHFMKKKEASPTAPAVPPQDIVLLTEIRDLLRKG
ncbi:MAG: large conductance mechanosensitive channel protein MscL [Alphaproteobacteria bacterium]